MNKAHAVHGMRFLHIGGEFQWKHLGEVVYLNPQAVFTDCTDMTDKQFEAFVRSVAVQ